ncbi:MAG: hypothetical protein JXA10_07100 [Anaerolineae bacterium]|nr:hypothetical protein [Anaerolineae bacterium]
MNSKARKPRILERGQGLVEYALILALAAVVVIGVAAVFGRSVQKTYCRAVWSIDAGIDAPMCDLIDVECHIISNDPFRLEAIVTDNMGDNDIKSVSFSVDGVFNNKEERVKYCLVSGDGQCSPYRNSGKHTFTAVAEDAEGNTGKCEITATVP